MRTLIRELSRFARTLPLEVCVRWHAHQALRLQRLSRQHKSALDTAMVDTRRLLEAS